MAKKHKNAPKGGVRRWREYLKWLEDKNSKPGEFRGSLSKLKDSTEDEVSFQGSTERGSASSALNAGIAAMPPFEGLVDDVGMRKAKTEWIIHHPWATKQEICNPFSDVTKALLTPHHLISCCVTEALTEHFTKVIENDIGYNVNSPHNLLILPNSTAMACYLGVPPHEGGHEYKLSAKELLSVQRWSKKNVVGKEVWEKTFDIADKGYHSRVLKLVHKVIVKHFKCEKDLDHNEFIKDMNKVSKIILKMLGKFKLLLHENGADYKPGKGNLAGCRNTRLVSSYIEGEGKEKAKGRESAKRVTKKFKILQKGLCSSERVHEDDWQYILYKGEGREKLRKMGMKVATEVEWIMSASTSETTATQDNKQTETA
ncbi:AHH domain-containing protein [Vibrio neptunius]|uniref:AHH domain-containing protein n=1 Tax=Vibrio neptunius TaxID=170651 RepID=UPI000696FED3|nr:AHH domain-containing protein [Vibrio neptunius]